ncbi:MAG: histidine kinase [Flavobacteriaceae bacterium]|nr:histidine kinase [Flavobacteriaceae bacterium]
MAFIPTVIGIFFIPIVFNKYTLAFVHEEQREQTQLLTFFEDIDHDGGKEKFDILNYRGKFASCLFKKNETALVLQFNFYGDLPVQEGINTPIFNDINKDGVKELFVFTQKNDSIFLNGVDFVASKVILSGRFVTTIGKGTEARDFVLRPIINHDLDADGIDEMYFLINGGFALYPRKILAYNFLKDTFLTTINTGSQHYITPVVKDGALYLYSTTPASGNCPENFEYPYRDNLARLFVFDEQLKLLRKPLEFEGLGASIDGPIVMNDAYHFYIKNTIAGKEQSILLKLDAKGGVLHQSNFKSLSVIWKSVIVTLEGEKRYLINCIENDLYKTYEYVPEKMALLENELTSKVNNATLIQINLFENEVSFMAVSQQFNEESSLFLEDLKFQLDFNRPLYVRPWNVYFQTKSNELGTVIKVTDRRKLYTYLLCTNDYYPFRFLIFIVVYGLGVLLVFAFKHYREFRSLQKNKLQHEIASLQLKLVNSQLDPHFTFNALNTVASKILKGERMEAYDLMTNFSDMLRAGLFFADANDWNLQQELKFTDAFLNLMKSRFSKMFDFTINLDKNISLEQLMIPRLLIQNFAQNSLKHAFTGFKGKGRLEIAVVKLNEHHLIKITDNGIGRKKGKEKAKNSTENSGKGIELNKKQIALYNALYKTNISFKIEDVLVNGLVCGTEVVICIPDLKREI